jgi:hypothetical protein
MCRVTRLSPTRFSRATALGNGTSSSDRSSAGFAPILRFSEVRVTTQVV